MARGEIDLRRCLRCGLVWNIAFDPTLVRYDDDYESTQACSLIFDRFHRDLARHLVKRYGLEDRAVAEIGSGQGEFLALFTELGAVGCVGIDPAIRRERVDPRISLIADRFTPQHIPDEAGLICCKMTLEHLADAGRFLAEIADAASRSHAPVFVMVPNAARIWEEGAFWDIYHEHVLYFDKDSLCSALLAAKLEPIEISACYADQYLAAHATTAGDRTGRHRPSPLPTNGLADFTMRTEASVAAWREAILQLGRTAPVVIWGGGSKAVAFLCATGCESDIRAVVDINPARQGTYLAGSGIEIVAPPALNRIRPGAIILMNGIYRDEVDAMLRDIHIAPRLLTLDDGPPQAMD